MLFLILIPLAAGLVWILLKRLASDKLTGIADKRRASSKVVSRGEFFDGNRHMPVSMALTDAALFYENADMQASLDRKWIEEVEYENELSTGQVVDAGTVLRLRSSSQTFEFVLPQEAIAQWKTLLPAHRMSNAT